MERLRRHAPLVVVLVVAVISTAAMILTDNSFVTSLAGNVWGIAVLLVAFDITPRDTKEKEERA